jgi:hypothetical protein
MAPQTDVLKLVTEQSGAKGDRARKPYGASHPRSARARPCLQIAGRRPLLQPPRSRLSKNSRTHAYCHVLPKVLDNRYNITDEGDLREGMEKVSTYVATLPTETK